MRGSGREAFARLSAPLAIGAIAIAGILAGGLAPSPLSAAPVALPDQAGWNDARQLIATPDGQDIAYVELGEDPETASGVPVMLIHGYTDNSRSWSLLAPALREALPKRRILALDLRGHGYSAKPACCYGIDSLAGDVGGLMAALNIEQADLVGHSLGSMTAAYLAATRPEKSGAWFWSAVRPAFPPKAPPGCGKMSPPCLIRSTPTAPSCATGTPIRPRHRGFPEPRARRIGRLAA
ncbi:alpha/beta fold hydrolase [Paracoccus cavernae]|uniref:Alpha/beta fold hydrolase n=1 Tax=Paracoccus cavernae TaxID=1571207 RepID=A0ABT8D5R0_9RHOB|nr:alpha/beta fold hydrolase [Paracoccus cavernae]